MLWSYMIVRNEADRYLYNAIDSLLPMVSGLLVYDDRSDDETAKIVQSTGAEYVLRPASSHSFLENESLFRQQAYGAMERRFSPREGDWVITLDADEQLYPSHCDESGLSDLGVAIAHANVTNVNGLILNVKEVFGDLGHHAFLVRTDGFWGKIEALRLFKYQPGGVFLDRGMGGGSVPSYVTNSIKVDSPEIIHYGYMREADRLLKHQRYISRKGHNPSHVKSILEPGVMVEWSPLQ